MKQLLTSLGFAQIGEVVEQRMVYEPDAAELAGEAGAVYVFMNPDGEIYKVGMTHKGFRRVNYEKVLDGRAMRRPNEQRKLALIREELHDGATQWVLRTADPELIEDLLAAVFRPSESRRKQSARERAIRDAIDRQEG